ncbi:MAG: flagellar assembly protein FliW [Actinomycetota bacterium]
MQVDSTRFGTFDVDPSRMLQFQTSLLGFPDSLRYVMVEVEDSPYFWLQSTDEADIAFLATTPFGFFPDYDLELSEAEQTALAIEDPTQVEVITLLTVHRAGDEPQLITANLLGPIVVNVETRQARQIVLANDDYSTREPLGA